MWRNGWESAKDGYGTTLPTADNRGCLRSNLAQQRERAGGSFVKKTCISLFRINLFKINAGDGNRQGRKKHSTS